MKYLERYQQMKEKACGSYWAQRILAEIGYAIKMSEVNDREFDSTIDRAMDSLYAAWKHDGAVTDQAAKKAEELLMPLSQHAKKNTVICAAHAHIDMNWQWGLQETVTITADTFRTMLQLMKEYPQFCYSQSQAAVYALMEQYYPEMIEEIRERVHEGRWEVSACNWVELDKNMPSAESMSRHLLYSKRYLANLLEIREDDICVDFEPDTFGHSSNVPEILTQANVHYYYHSRGQENVCAYNWEAPSGASILVWREPVWYNCEINYDMCLGVPEFCREYGIDVMLRVYGVGDHGGGPSRRDIERILDMQSWPIYPTIQFGTYRQFFERLETFKENLPTVHNEMNYLLTGCYTSQAKIKMANRIGEARAYDAEMLAVLAKMAAGDKKEYTKSFEQAWRKILFNQFHDILPGSGKAETREHAMGSFQEAMAYIDSNANKALHTIAGQIDTSSVYGMKVEADSTSEGAGVGYNVSYAQGEDNFNTQKGPFSDPAYRFAGAERGSGKTRVYHVFNTTQYLRTDLAELTVWDWNGDPDRMQIEDADGEVCEHQLLEKGVGYWGHRFHKVAVRLSVPAFGYTTCVVREKKAESLYLPKWIDIRKDDITDEDLVLENENIRAVFDAATMELRSFFDKNAGHEMLAPEQKSGYFEYILENDINRMTAWRTGPAAVIQNINETCPVRVVDKKLSGIQQWICYEIPFKDSRLTAVVQLNKGAAILKYSVTVDWREFGVRGVGVPQLRFCAPFADKTERYCCEVPGGVLDRKPLRQDIPSNRFIASMPQDTEHSWILTTDCKYGYRGCDNTLMVNLIRAFFDPDEWPEIGSHKIQIGLGICEKKTEEFYRIASCFEHPFYSVSNTAHKGKLALKYAGLDLTGAVQVSAVKLAEDDENKVIVRCCNTKDTEETICIRGISRTGEAYAVNTMEHPGSEECISFDGEIRYTLKPHSVRSIIMTNVISN